MQQASVARSEEPRQKNHKTSHAKKGEQSEGSLKTSHADKKEQGRTSSEVQASKKELQKKDSVEKGASQDRPRTKVTSEVQEQSEPHSVATEASQQAFGASQQQAKKSTSDALSKPQAQEQIAPKGQETGDFSQEKPRTLQELQQPVKKPVLAVSPERASQKTQAGTQILTPEKTQQALPKEEGAQGGHKRVALPPEREPKQSHAQSKFSGESQRAKDPQQQSRKKGETDVQTSQAAVEHSPLVQPLAATVDQPLKPEKKLQQKGLSQEQKAPPVASEEGVSFEKGESTLPQKTLSQRGGSQNEGLPPQSEPQHKEEKSVSLPPKEAQALAPVQKRPDDNKSNSEQTTLLSSSTPYQKEDPMQALARAVAHTPVQVSSQAHRQKNKILSALPKQEDVAPTLIHSKEVPQKSTKKIEHGPQAQSQLAAVSVRETSPSRSAFVPQEQKSVPAHVVRQPQVQIQPPREDRVSVAPASLVSQSQQKQPKTRLSPVESLHQAMAAFRAQEEAAEARKQAEGAVDRVEMPLSSKAFAQSSQAAESTSRASSLLQSVASSTTSTPVASASARPQVQQRGRRRGLTQDLKRELAMMAMQDTSPYIRHEIPSQRSAQENEALLHTPHGAAPLLNSTDERQAFATTAASHSASPAEQTRTQEALSALEALSKKARALPSVAAKDFPDLRAGRRTVIHHAPNMAKMRAAQMRKKEK